MSCRSAPRGRPRFPGVSVILKVDLSRPGSSRRVCEHDLKLDIRLSLRIDVPAPRLLVDVLGEESASANDNKVIPSTLLPRSAPDGENVDKRWVILRHRELIFRHVDEREVTVLLFPCGSTFDLDTSHLNRNSFHHEDVVADIHLGDSDIDAAVKKFRHHGQVPTSPEERSLAARFGVFLGGSGSLPGASVPCDRARHHRLDVRSCGGLRDCFSSRVGERWFRCADWPASQWLRRSLALGDLFCLVGLV
jgi:hypothetical protein